MRAAFGRRCAVLAGSLALAGGAQAQLGGSIVAASDERYRGISLSGEQPTLRLTVSYDHPAGGYAGASVAALRPDPGDRQAVLLAYAGWSGEIDDDLRWDAGLTATHWSSDQRYNYGEAYAGVGGERWSLRLNYSPDYYGRGVGTFYAETDAHLVLAPSWRLAVHVGALRRSDGTGDTRVDGRVGVVLRALELDWQLAYVAVTRSGPFPLPYHQHAQRAVASVAYAF